MSKVPEPWASRLVERGFTDRRSANSSTPSVGALADALDLNTTTITEAISGKRRPNPTTVAMLMNALGRDVADWLGLDYHGPWTPPPEAALLTSRQRKALDELIRSMTAGASLLEVRNETDEPWTDVRVRLRPADASDRDINAGDAEAEEQLRGQQAARRTKDGKRSATQQRLAELDGIGEESQDANGGDA